MQQQISEILATLASLSSARIKKHYVSQGVREPMFGVPVGVLKPIAKPLIGNQALAEGLYASGNYDAMYLAGMIANTQTMTPDDFRRWIGRADCYMLSEFVVAVTLAETDFAQPLADEFINDPGEFVQSGDGVATNGCWARAKITNLTRHTSNNCWIGSNRPSRTSNCSRNTP